MNKPYKTHNMKRLLTLLLLPISVFAQDIGRDLAPDNAIAITDPKDNNILSENQYHYRTQN
ncbi:hypothetical protein [Flavobacterium soli]|uniref:hypothetical protein n=1 Tax=Flavobacterium soli TaxID=344881 RepID=UPI00047B7986|nr:hypothetical protein [Flavobacterium soli]